MGYFTNTVKCEWPEEGDGRTVILLEDIAYVDNDGRTWQAHRGDEVDGANIPRFFWRIVGSPFVGLFRYASVIHDVFCKNKSRPWQDVHKVFEEMMIDKDVPDWKRKLMAKAVWYGGPRWKER